MEHAWLDSLSEDWVSQPGSDNSAGQLPPLKDIERIGSQKRPDRSVHISSRRLASVAAQAAHYDSSINVLSERSANDINIPRSRLPSKFSRELNNPPVQSGSRSVSTSTDGSVVHNAALPQTSPGNDNSQTPEWKRRLVYGNMQYGEQRDLFCSAAEGLQDMFKPPADPADQSLDGSDPDLHEATMPSSPPASARPTIEPELENIDGIDNLDDEEDDIHDQITPSPSPRKPQREIKYKLNLADSSVLPQDSTPSYRRSTRIYRDESCLSVPAPEDDRSRKTSGQSCIHNEDFSPILIGKHSDQNGGVEFAPIEVPATELRQKLEHLRLNQMLLDSQRGQMDEEDDEAEGEDAEGNIENTDDFVHNGGYLNLRRGGRSADGSFRQRALSPPLEADFSEMLPEESLQASTPKQFPTIRTQGTLSLGSPSLPRAPFPSPEKWHVANTASSPSGGSPLKLFGPYDTFTNQTLLRRISQFEQGMSGSASKQSLASDSAQPSPPAADLSGESGTSGPINRFGSGELAGYKFNGDAAEDATEDSIVDDDKENVSPGLMSFPNQAARQHTLSQNLDLYIRRRRGKSSTQSRDSHVRAFSGYGSVGGTVMPREDESDFEDDEGGGPKRDAGSEGKRPRTSPSKDPTPKRRRTLHRSDIAYGRDERNAALDGAHELLQASVGKKRRDSRSGGFQLASPEILALRSILRPRSPTPSQQSWDSRDRNTSPALRPQGASSPLAGREGTSFSTDAPLETERKPSIRTQDFVDQAAQIMAMIRSQVRPTGLASVEESEVETMGAKQEGDDDSYQSSTKEPLSRPPSRDGKPIPKSASTQQSQNPELLKKLKKYQELSDMGDIVSSSMRSMSLAKDAIRAAQDVERQLASGIRARPDAPIIVEGEFESDIPNIRLSTNPAAQDPDFLSPSRDFPSNSSGHSSNRSYPTASSRGSESRKTIMPESVSHLIPERVGSMCLDKTNNVWVKKKEEAPTVEPNPPASDVSEDDPFASIPDLTVDVTQEMRHLRLTSTQRESASESVHEADFPESPPKTGQRQNGHGFVTLSPNGQLNPTIAPLAKNEFEKLDSRRVSEESGHEAEQSENPVAETEDNASPTTRRRRRNLTISFSSPVASIIRDVSPEDLDSLEDDPDLQADEDVGAQEDADFPVEHEATGATSARMSTNGSTRDDTKRGLSRPAPLRSHSSFVPRPVSRIDEQDEDSTVELPHVDQRQLSVIEETSMMSHLTPDVRQTSLSFYINQTPGQHALSMHADESAVIGQNVGKLSLSPLSEFTLNNPDQSFGFEVSYVMGHRHMATGDGSRRVMSMTIRELVDKLSEVEPFEPFWEDITHLDLQDKRLSSLHMLNEFCGRLVSLDASQNALGHLEGIPSCVRQLKVSNNLLTELTSWDHLMNLQYVDISNNEVKSLSALKNLVHLRSIKADNNQLTSLDGLDCHDGLLSLRARNNSLEDLDFAGLQLERLTELDVEDNQITSVRNLGMLPALAKLRLSGNKLSVLDVEHMMRSLRELDLNDNEIIALDLSKWPNLHSLHADRNRIEELCGFEGARRLDSLSLREQRGGRLDLSFLSTAYEVRKLFLSGNRLEHFELEVDFLNLQLLELANCGLQALPEKLGQLMPNLRALNVNFNAVSDLRPLRYVPRLKKLLVAGNRLADSTTVTELLTDFPHLTQLDVRDNPMTLGFYAPLQVLVLVHQDKRIDPFVLPDADSERDEQYASRLDETTRLRRRLHQVVFAGSCRRLRKLDGLSLRRADVLAKDDVWQVLVAEGLLPPSPEVETEETLVDESEMPGKEPGSDETEPAHRVAADEPGAEGEANETHGSSLWPAENSFA